MRVAQLFRYPVKGLSAQPLASANLVAGHGVLGDRAFAIAHGSSTYDVREPAWQQRRNFLNVAHSPQLASLTVELDESLEWIRLGNLDKEAAEYIGPFSRGAVGEELTGFLAQYVADSQPPPYLIACGRDIAVDAGFTDSEKQGVSIINMASIEALSAALRAPVDAGRFRANICVDGAAPWAELTWPGQMIRVGASVLRVIEPITRCAAVDTEPGSGKRELRVLEALKPLCGALIFGVLAEVISAGEISPGDELHIVSETQ